MESSSMNLRDVYENYVLCAHFIAKMISSLNLCTTCVALADWAPFKGL